MNWSRMSTRSERGQTVIITGTGFDPLMPVSFANGSLLPAVSNVLYIDPTTLQATVLPGSRKRLKDSVLDVHVGAPSSYTGTAVKVNAFTIITP